MTDGIVAQAEEVVVVGLFFYDTGCLTQTNGYLTAGDSAVMEKPTWGDS